jgi:splicing factor 1
MARDCFQKGGPAGGFGGPTASAPKTQFDSEYQNLMNELGEGGGGAQGAVRGAITANGEPGAQGGDGGVKIPPWRIPENWFSNCKSDLRLRSRGGADGFN